MKKLYILTFCLILASMNILSASATFSDVPESSQYFSAIEFLQKNGIISGHSDGTFKPEDPVNRAEALKMVLLGTGVSVEETTEVPTFSDVNKTDWFIKFLVKGVKNTIVNGNPDGTFAPGRKVNKAELLKMLLISSKIDLSKHMNLTKAVSNDVNSSDWFAPYLSYAKTTGIVYPDIDNNLEPGKNLNRAEVAEIVYRLIITVKGGDTQKMLSITEASLVSVLVDLKVNDINSALNNASSAVFYSEQALSQKPDEALVKSANKIANAFRELCYAYKAGVESSPDSLRSHVENAKNLANEALSYSSEVQSLVTKINEQASLLLSQV